MSDLDMNGDASKDAEIVMLKAQVAALVEQVRDLASHHEAGDRAMTEMLASSMRTGRIVEEVLGVVKGIQESSVKIEDRVAMTRATVIDLKKAGERRGIDALSGGASLPELSA